MAPLLLSAALLKLMFILPGVLVTGQDTTPISIVVTNSVTNSSDITYHTHVVNRGILLGGMKRLQDSKEDFKFKYFDNRDYGPYLVSVNGLHETVNQTYWAFLVRNSTGQEIQPDVGIGCYIPEKDDKIILKYTHI